MLQRVLSKRPPRRPRQSRGRFAILVGVALIVLVALSARGIATVFTDYLWFDSLGVVDEWQRQWGYRTIVGLLFGLAFFVLLGGNLMIANRLQPVAIPRRTGDELVERYRELVGVRQRTVWLGAALVFSVLAGLGASSQWRSWVLFRFGGEFGTSDAEHGIDLSFYVFKLPFLSYAVSWLFAALIIVSLFTAMAHYLTGGLQVPGSGAVATGRVKIHLSVLFSSIAIVKAADYFLERYRLTLSRRGVVAGALYTEANVTQRSMMLLMLVSLVVAVAFIVNVRRRGWGLPSLTIGLWLVLSIIAGMALPALVQRIKVDPNESALERPYIARNIEATRFAMGLDRVVEQDFDYTGALTDDQITANAATVSNVRLLDPTVVPNTFSTLQSIYEYYRFADLDVDRYVIDGAETGVVLGARELNQAALPVNTWEAKHLSYTHGYGAAMARANAVNREGEPEFVVSDIPARVESSELETVALDRPEIYFGEGFDRNDAGGYAVVGTSVKEEGDQYEGDGGVSIGSLVRQVAFALRFGDLEVLTSNYLNENSRVLYIRNVAERAAAVAPFLRWDNDPYPVLLDGGIKYVIDGYTVSSAIPYAEPARSGDLEAGADLRYEDFNYIRNSVKAVVDAYDGSVTLYLSDTLYGEPDPIIRAYAAAFPNLFTPIDEMSEELRSHLRYPEDLFRLQTQTWARYHLDDPGDLYSQQDGWNVAQRPPNDTGRDSSTTNTASSSEPIAPNYLQMRLPGERIDEFVLLRPFVPHSGSSSSSPKKQLNAFMVARNDPAEYGQLVVYSMTEEGPDGTTQRNSEVPGPLSAHENMVSTTRLSQRLAQLNSSSGSSVVTFGNMVIVPIGEGIMYVRPIYVASEAQGSSQQLRIVVVSVGSRVGIGDTYAEALASLFPSAQITTAEEGPIDGDVEDDVVVDDLGRTAEDYLIDALRRYDEADELLRGGGVSALSDYQQAVSEAEDLVRRAAEALGAVPSADPQNEATDDESG